MRHDFYSHIKPINPSLVFIDGAVGFGLDAREQALVDAFLIEQAPGLFPSWQPLEEVPVSSEPGRPPKSIDLVLAEPSAYLGGLTQLSSISRQMGASILSAGRKTYMQYGLLQLAGKKIAVFEAEFIASSQKMYEAIGQLTTYRGLMEQNGVLVVHRGMIIPTGKLHDDGMRAVCANERIAIHEVEARSEPSRGKRDPNQTNLD